MALPDNGFVIPPDTMGAVGPNHVLTMLNSQVRVQNKFGIVSSTVSLATFWTAGTGLVGSPFDPHVIYDTLSGRWIAVCDANAQAATAQIWLAVSQTSDPTGAWSFYSFQADATGVTWADYPGVGVNKNWIVITNNMFTVAGNVFKGAKMWVIDKATALGGGVLTVTIFPTGFDNTGTGNGFTLQPAVTFDANQGKLYIVDSGWAASGGRIDYIRLSQITGTGAAPVWSVVPDAAGPIPGSGLFTAAKGFNSIQVNAQQKGAAQPVWTNDPRVLNAVFRNGRLWFTHSGGLPNEPMASTRTASFCYQIAPTRLNTTGNPIVQSGVLDPGVAGGAIFFPSIAVNKNNDAVVGFSRSDATRYVEAAFAARRGSDPKGMFGPVQVFKSGEAPYYKTFGGMRNRWGDYSATVVDPSDDFTFWTIQEYAGANGMANMWGTWWAKITIWSLIHI